MTAVILQASDVQVSFRGMTRPAVNEVNLAVEAGAAIGIVGESGSGKTTLARVLAGALRPTGGEIIVEGRSWDSVQYRDHVRRRVQMVFQDAVGALNPWMTARETVAEVIRFWHRCSRSEARQRAGELLREMGLATEAVDRRPGGLSGGQCQRVGVARALAAEPDVLIADEPTSSLDVSVQAQILNLLTRLQRERNLALVLISHDLGVVRHLTDDAVVMYRGRIVERGHTESLMSRAAHPYTQLLIESGSSHAAEVGSRHRNAVDEGHPCVFAGRCPHIQPDCESVLIEPGAQAAVVCRHPLRQPVAVDPIR